MSTRAPRTDAQRDAAREVASKCPGYRTQGPRQPGVCANCLQYKGDHLDRGTEKVDNNAERPSRGFRGIEDALTPEEWEAEQERREYEEDDL